MGERTHTPIINKLLFISFMKRVTTGVWLPIQSSALPFAQRTIRLETRAFGPVASRFFPLFNLLLLLLLPPRGRWTANGTERGTIGAQICPATASGLTFDNGTQFVCFFFLPSLVLFYPKGSPSSFVPLATSRIPISPWPWPPFGQGLSTNEPRERQASKHPAHMCLGSEMP